MKATQPSKEEPNSGQLPEALPSVPAVSQSQAAGVVELTSVLARHPFLRGLKREHLETLAKCAMPVRHVGGAVIFREGDPANRFYLIEQGHVAVEATEKDGRRVPVQVIGPGDVLGWSWLFPPYTWHFDARAVEPISAIFFYGSRLREQGEEDHDFGFEMMKRMAQVILERLQATRRELSALRG
jgi:CRP-like cAMP-binding protein